MAAAAVLPPNQSFEMSLTAKDVSQARQRRRRTTRKTDGIQKSRSQGGDLNLDLSSSLRPGSVDDAISSDLGSSAAVSTPGSIDSVIGVNSRLGETARQRRRTRLKKRDTQKSVTVSDPSSTDQRRQPELEDSTAGVASLLQKKLHQTEQEEHETYHLDNQTDSQGPTILHNDEHPMPYGSNGHGGTDTAVGQEQEPISRLDRPLPQLVPIDTGSVGSHDQESLTPTTTDILCITIHATDALKASVKISHPCIRVTVIDSSLEPKGALAKKSQPDRCVTSFYERGNPNVDYIMPVLTQPFICSQHSQSLQPSWEETLIFNEQLTHFTANKNILIFFELLDFSTIDNRVISGRGTVVNSDQTPWYRIAWGFLRPAGKICKTQMGQKCRIQLFKFPKRRFKSSTESKEVYGLWTEHYRTVYPSTLYVTLKGIPNEVSEQTGNHFGPSLIQPSGRSMIPTLGEVGTLTLEQLLHKQQGAKSASSLVTQPSALLSETARLPGQACHVPTTHTATLRHTRMGCSALAFSHSGRLLAAGCADHEDVYPLIIYEVPSFQPVFVTEGHRSIIYDLSWDGSDSMLATASGDGLVKLWSMDSPTPEPAFILPHPCYVYSVCYTNDTLIFTGAYDGNIRLWSIPTEPSESPKLLCELRGHSSLVNCLLWSTRERTLYSGDSRGEVGVWREGQGEWSLHKKINVVKGCALTSLSLHPSGRKLLLHTVRGGLVMLDLRINLLPGHVTPFWHQSLNVEVFNTNDKDRVCCEYKGINISQSQRCSSTISPCGGLLFAAAQPGQVLVWNTDNGSQVHSYTEQLSINSTVSAMAYHPGEHMIIFSAYGSHEPIVVLTHKVELAVKTQTKHSTKTKSRPKKGQSLSKSEMTSTMHTSARLSEVARTLSRVTAFVGAKTPKS